MKCLTQKNIQISTFSTRFQAHWKWSEPKDTFSLLQQHSTIHNTQWINYFLLCWNIMIYDRLSLFQFFILFLSGHPKRPSLRVVLDGWRTFTYIKASVLWRSVLHSSCRFLSFSRFCFDWNKNREQVQKSLTGFLDVARQNQRRRTSSHAWNLWVIVFFRLSVSRRLME